MGIRNAVVILVLSTVLPLGCGGKGGGAEAQLSVQGELAQEQLNAIRSAFESGDPVEQEFNCAFLMGTIEGHEETDADRKLSEEARTLCYGELHKAMYEQTVADVRARADRSAIPFLECVPAQAALADEAKEVDVPGLAEARSKAIELCKRAWDE